MTTQEIIDYYADLLILQYKSKPKAYATIQAFVAGFIVDQLPVTVENAFDIESAVGVQLDLLGYLVGVERTGHLADGTTIMLDDSDFRQLIKMAISRNNLGSSLADIDDFLELFFPAQIFAFDQANMQMSYFMDGNVGSINLAKMFVVQGLLPKPMGVELASLIYLLVTDNLFGYRRYNAENPNATGFNTYSSYDLSTHWLSYADVISI